jgi:hypothetical protein
MVHFRVGDEDREESGFCVEDELYCGHPLLEESLTLVDGA